MLNFIDFFGAQMVNEDYALVPRFTLKKKEVFDDFPVGKELDVSEELLTKAVKYGMILLLKYKNPEEDRGRERVVYPMVLGKSGGGELLMRGFHFKGWSHGLGKPVEKIWRIFRFDRITKMAFTGSFYRVPPSGYNQDDPGFAGGVTVAADFAEIRANQQALVKALVIQGEGETELKPDKGDIIEVEAESTGENLDLAKPWESSGALEQDTAKNVRITFLKSQFGTTRVALLGVLAMSQVNAVASGEEDEPEATAGKDERVIKLYDRQALKGSFEVVGACMGDELGTPERGRVDGAAEYEVYVYKARK